MIRPRTVTIAVFSGILLVVAVVAGVVWTTTDGATAIQVGDTSVSRKQVNDELAALADFRPDQWKTTPGALVGEVSTQATTLIVQDLLAREYLADEGARVSSADRDAARKASNTAGFQQLPEWFQDVLVERQATFTALARVSGDDTSEAAIELLRREARRTPVTVDPVYGRWAPAKVAVVPYPTPPDAAQG